jgi:hypothetical protein
MSDIETETDEQEQLDQRKIIARIKSKASNFFKNKIVPLRESAVALAARNPRYASMALLVVLYSFLALVVRLNDDGYYPTVNGRTTSTWHPSGWSQLLFAVAVFLSPFVLAFVGTHLRKRLESFLKRQDGQTGKQPTALHVSPREYFSSDIYGTVVGIRLLLEYLLFSLSTYLIVSALAWKQVGQTHHWIWNDRQTIGFVFTILLSIFAALFSNSLRDLFQQNNQAFEKIDETVVKARHLLDQLTEIGDRLWAEFEVQFKEDGKLFLYRANEFVHRQSDDVLTPLVEEISARANSLDQSNINEMTADRLSEEIDKLDPTWSQYGLSDAGGVLRLDYNKESQPLRLDPWSVHIRLSDYSGSQPVQVSTPDEFHKHIKDKSFRDTKQDIRLLLIKIARSLTNPDDGRFFVIGNLDEDAKNRLAVQRRCKSLVAYVVTRREEKLKSWGFFPTDETITYSLINLMLMDKAWLASHQGEGFEEWLASVYRNLFSFHEKNKARFGTMKELLGKVSELLDDQGIPSSLLLDDLHLFGELLQIGSDGPLPAGTSLPEQQMKTTARMITYAASFYAAMVWNADPGRSLLPNFPSPFSHLRDLNPGESSRMLMHPSARFLKLERATNDLLKETVITDDFEGPAWSMALELSYRQGPLTNWIRAAGAYRSRETFLNTHQAHWHDVKLISKTPDSRKELMKILFPSPGASNAGESDHGQRNRAEQLLISHETTDVLLRLGGHRSLKVQRKSGIQSLVRDKSRV